MRLTPIPTALALLWLSMPLYAQAPDPAGVGDGLTLAVSPEHRSAFVGWTITD